MVKKWIGLSLLFVCSISLHAMAQKDSAQSPTVSVAQVASAQQGIIILQNKAIYAVRALQNRMKISNSFLHAVLQSNALVAFRNLIPSNLITNVEQLAVNFDKACASKNFGKINFAYNALIAMLEVCKNDLQTNYADYIATNPRLRPAAKPVHGKQKDDAHQAPKEQEFDKSVKKVSFADKVQIKTFDKDEYVDQKNVKPERSFVDTQMADVSDVQSGANTAKINAIPPVTAEQQPMPPMPIEEEFQKQFEQYMKEQQQQQQPGFFSSLMRDPIKMLIGASLAGLTVYGVLANIFEWWPFSQQKAAPVANPVAPEPVASNTN